MNGHSLIDWQYIVQGAAFIAPYVKVTLLLTLSSVFFGAVLGLVSCLAQRSQVPALGKLFRLYVYVCRSIPNMVLLYLVTTACRLPSWHYAARPASMCP